MRTSLFSFPLLEADASVRSASHISHLSFSFGLTNVHDPQTHCTAGFGAAAAAAASASGSSSAASALSASSTQRVAMIDDEM